MTAHDHTPVQDLQDAFAELRLALDRLASAVRADEGLALWLPSEPDSGRSAPPPRERLLQLCLALWTPTDGDARATVGCPGLVGSSPETLERVRACNIAKDRFRRRVLALRKRSPAALERAVNALGDGHIGERRGTRLHLNQAYRHVPWLSACPRKVGFTWSRSGRVIEPLSVAAARDLLDRRARRADVGEDPQRLATLDPHARLARVRQLRPHLRANVVFDAAGEQVRRLVQAPLPLFLPLKPGQLLPEFVPPEPGPPAGSRRRLRRSDARLEPEPFLPSIRVHRYLPEGSG